MAKQEYSRRNEHKGYLYYMKICPICNRRFDTSGFDLTNYAYKKGGIYSCSWTCFKKLDKKTPAQLKKLKEEQSKQACQ
jgi:hypothetical protein